MKKLRIETGKAAAKADDVPTIIATIPRHVLQMSRQYGVDADLILSDLGLTHAQIEDPDGRIPVPTHAQLYRRVVVESGNPAIALESGQLMSTGVLRVVGYILMTSATLLEAYRNLARYWGLLSEGSCFSVNLTEKAGQRKVELDIRFQDPRIGSPKEGIESITSHCIAMGRKITGQRFSALEMHYPYPEPAYGHRYQELFGGNVLFDQPHTKIVLAAGIARLTTLHPDPLLTTTLKTQADLTLEQLTEEQGFVRRVRDAITDRLSTEQFDIAAVANHLQVGERTLQRRLNAQRTSFSVLLMETRKNRALQLLSQPDQSITEIAFLTGYSERSAFDRAFKKWTGLPPLQFRRKSAGQQ